MCPPHPPARNCLDLRPFFCYNIDRGVERMTRRMKDRFSLLRLVVLLLISHGTFSARAATLVTFDDLSDNASGAWFTSPYYGLNWINILHENSILSTSLVGLTGNYYGMVSPSNVVGLASGAEITSPGTNFNFLSAYLTGCWNSNLNIEVEGFRDTNLVYDETKVASATNPTLFTFNYLNIDELEFNSYGGLPAFGYGPGTAFVMDNFTFEFIPEPSAFLLAALGGVSLIALLKRKRA